ncbi:MAG: hypothetical protein A2X79_06250 [Desulfuromonadaceae bacterium GWB2_53_15]|nr:MAG: hypothetical protein A2X83_02730 [Desulfuromonadales bacterium GWD2_54_10]OHB26777.1 MAG: hypothetical protein A2X79_06250 [Desulfuromonadaceae bacterium GWB2_53_15]
MSKIITVNNGFLWSTDTPSVNTGKILEEDLFHHVLSRERKRSERTQESMLLLLLDIGAVEDKSGRENFLAVMSETILSDIRDTDACGWLKTDSLLGIVFTSIPDNAVEHSRDTVESKVREYLQKNLVQSLNEKINLSVLVFPDKRGGKEGREWGDKFNPYFYPEIIQKDLGSRVANYAKRVMDIVGSTIGLIIFSPIFLIVSILVKATSHGPVFFRQERLGQFGKPFVFLKFRSMHTNNNDAIHREFIKNFIDNNLKNESESRDGTVVFKIRNDPRITPIGNFLRKSSIDELPQLLNVLMGDMSLVGPRPPIPYEVADYGVWHWFRILARKPGITGLWQVRGRSLTTFDGMVRLDLKYIRSWSLWLDIKLLLATPMAVLRGKGAY